jgi:hypothetical protein
MHHKPCIVCASPHHTVWNCDNLTGPIVVGAWIHRSENVPEGLGRRARRVVEGWVGEMGVSDAKRERVREDRNGKIEGLEGVGGDGGGVGDGSDEKGNEVEG